jgi:hypothetical protein
VYRRDRVNKGVNASILIPLSSWTQKHHILIAIDRVIKQIIIRFLSLELPMHFVVEMTLVEAYVMLLTIVIERFLRQTTSLKWSTLMVWLGPAADG